MEGSVLAVCMDGDCVCTILGRDKQPFRYTDENCYDAQVLSLGSSQSCDIDRSNSYGCHGLCLSPDSFQEQERME